jgi:hypothetical protein
VRSWLELWKLLKPDVIVTDYAPSAILSAKIAGIPTLPFGPGFSIPPGQDPMPAFREEERQALDRGLHKHILRGKSKRDTSRPSQARPLFGESSVTRMN